MTERLAVRDVRFYMRNVRTRMPFRYGVATLTSVPILHVLVDVEMEDGTLAVGAAADILPPKWFDKDPAKSYADNVDDLVFVARAAAAGYAGAPGSPASVFDIWQEGYAATLAAGDGRSLNHLTSSHGSTLMERALIDAVGRARNPTTRWVSTLAPSCPNWPACHTSRRWPAYHRPRSPSATPSASLTRSGTPTSPQRTDLMTACRSRWRPTCEFRDCAG